jgi:hypothetical protein
VTDAPTRVDWPALILALRRAGMTVEDIVAATDTSRGAVHGWLVLGAEPRFSVGVILLKLHAERVPPAVGRDSGPRPDA